MNNNKTAKCQKDKSLEVFESPVRKDGAFFVYTMAAG